MLGSAVWLFAREYSLPSPCFAIRQGCVCQNWEGQWAYINLDWASPASQTWILTWRVNRLRLPATHTILSQQHLGFDFSALGQGTPGLLDDQTGNFVGVLMCLSSWPEPPRLWFSTIRYHQVSTVVKLESSQVVCLEEPFEACSHNFPHTTACEKVVNETDFVSSMRLHKRLPCFGSLFHLAERDHE